MHQNTADLPARIGILGGTFGFIILHFPPLVKERFVKIDDDDRLIWVDDSYNGKKYGQEKRLAKQRSLAFYGEDSSKDSVGLVELFPMAVFDAFDEAYILTYMFDCQLQSYYFNYYGLNYTNLYVKGDKPENFTFTDDINERRADTKDYRKLITIYSDLKLEKMCKKRTALSKKWFQNQNS